MRGVWGPARNSSKSLRKFLAHVLTMHALYYQNTLYFLKCLLWESGMSTLLLLKVSMISKTTTQCSQVCSHSKAWTFRWLCQCCQTTGRFTGKPTTPRNESKQEWETQWLPYTSHCQTQCIYILFLINSGYYYNTHYYNTHVFCVYVSKHCSQVQFCKALLYKINKKWPLCGNNK